MENWKRRGNAKNVAEYLEQNGYNIAELANPKKTPSDWIGGMRRVANIINIAIDKKQHITIFGDYDADGECATAILWLALVNSGVPETMITVRLPKRFSEGYGINENVIEEFTPGLIICVDNGIAAHDAIKKAREKNFAVVVLDHHLAPDGDLVPAHAVVDQHVDVLRNNISREGENFNSEYIQSANEACIDYCGAGLAFKLAELLIPEQIPERDTLLSKLSAIAAIATVADSVPLVGENRIIVKNGLKAINKALAGEPNTVTLGMKSILDALRVNEMQEEDIAFRLAPIMNAPARLMDTGARIPCAVLCQDKREIPKVAQDLIEINNARKEKQNASFARVNEIIHQQGYDESPPSPIVIFDEQGSKGLIGIVAGKIAETYKVPAIVFSLSEDKTQWDGSARAYDESVHIKECLDKVSSHLLHYGGHSGAAGLAIQVGNEKAFMEAIRKTMESKKGDEPADVQYYDIETTVDSLPLMLAQLNSYGPFGAGVPAPVFCIRGVRAEGYGGKFGRLMGSEQQHIRFDAVQKKTYGQRPTKISLVAFGLAEKYLSYGGPEYFDVIGTLGFKNDNYGKAIQFNVTDIRC